jgi:hypothetical protein
MLSYMQTIGENLERTMTHRLVEGGESCHRNVPFHSIQLSTSTLSQFPALAPRIYAYCNTQALPQTSRTKYMYLLKIRSSLGGSQINWGSHYLILYQVF